MSNVVCTIGVHGWQADPCPFCGAEEPYLSMEFIGTTGKTGRIVCDECQTRGPIETIEGEEDESGRPDRASNIVTKAIALWNVRGREK